MNDSEKLAWLVKKLTKLADYNAEEGEMIDFNDLYILLEKLEKK